MSKAHSRQKSWKDFRVGKFLRNSSLWLNIKRPGRCAPWGEQGGGYCVWLLVKIEEQHGTVIPSDSHSGFYFPPSDESDYQTIRHQTGSLCGFLSNKKNSEHLHAFLFSNIQHSTFHHLLRRWSPFLSRTGNVSQAFHL